MALVVGEKLLESRLFTPVAVQIEACGIQFLYYIIDLPHNMNKPSRDTSSVLSEWHDRGERRPINSGDSMAYEYALRGCLEFILSYMRFAGDASKFMMYSTWR